MADPPESDPPPSGEVSTAKGSTTVVDLSPSQQTSARRMAESRATIPDLTVTTDVHLDARPELRDAAPDQPGPGDAVLLAAATALREHPRANASYRDGRLLLHSRINIGITLFSGHDLFIPTIFDADQLTLQEIARRRALLSDRVQDRTITPPELGGGTFTISDLGPYGARSFTPVIVPPQAAILSLGALLPRAPARDGELVTRSALTLTLVCDHRILHGAGASLFLSRIRDLLEGPAELNR
jgi:pyruvate dehydrogenase E2 component (dihydrolipoamide acetyltransferase)